MKTSIFLICFVFLLHGAEIPQQQSRPPAKPSRTHAMLQGIWWSEQLPQSAAFTVNDSTFYYPDELAYRKYKLNGDTLHIYFEDDRGILSLAIVKLTPDTLILSAFGELSVYTRAEPQR